MPRDGSGIYSKPSGTTAVPNTTIESAKFNSVVDDLVSDANTARPIVAGGTGATSASAARTALGVPATSDVDGKQIYAVKSGNYTALAIDNNAFHNFTGATPTLSLTAAATLGANWHYDGLSAGGPVIIDPNGAELINGVPSITVPQGCKFSINCDASAFVCVVGTAQTYVDNSITTVANRIIGKNRVTNGDMRISQDGTSFASPASGSYTLDQWLITWTGAAPASVAQVTGPTGFQKAMRVTGAASNTVTVVNHRIPSADIADLVGSSAFLQANLSASVGQTFAWSAFYANALDNFSGTTIFATGTWTVTTSAQTFTASLGTLPASAANGVQINIAPNNGGAFTSGTFDLTGVQLEKGTAANAFEFMSYSEQLRRCQFFYSIFPYIIIGTSGSDTQTPLPVTMRATPSFSGGGAGFNTANSSAGFMVASQTTRAAQTIKCNARL